MVIAILAFSAIHDKSKNRSVCKSGRAAQNTTTCVARSASLPLQLGYIGLSKHK